MLMALSLLVLGGLPGWGADTPRTNAVRYADTLSGGKLWAIGNSQLRFTSGTGTQNNDGQMNLVDVDGIGSTTNSSSANLTLPTNADIRAAYLYWTFARRTEASVSTAYSVQLRHANDTGYSTITSDTDGNGTPNVNWLTANSVKSTEGVADVTAFVRAHGAGRYTVANLGIETDPGNAAISRDANVAAGWSLWVVYRDPGRSEPKRIIIYDQWNTANNSTINFPLDGFRTPPVSGFGVFAWVWMSEGDLGLTGDRLRINGTDLTNAINRTGSTQNLANSTISRFGINVTDREPAGDTRFAVTDSRYSLAMAQDLDAFDATDLNLIAPGATTAAAAFTTTNDQVQYGTTGFEIEVFEPSLAIGFTKSVSDNTGGAVSIGDILTYTCTITNTGKDTAVQCQILDDLPTGTTYIANTLRVVRDDGAGIVVGSPVTRSDGTGDDQAEYLALGGGRERVLFRVGAGADAAAGGSLGIGQVASVRFQVVVDGTLVNNSATAAYVGQISGTSLTATSNIAQTAAGRTILPTLNSSVLLHLDASLPESLSKDAIGKLQGWYDRSGNGRVFTNSVTTARPVVNPAALNGKDTVSFAGGGKSLIDSTWPANRDLSLFIVYRRDVAGTLLSPTVDVVSSGTNQGKGFVVSTTTAGTTGRMASSPVGSASVTFPSASTDDPYGLVILRSAATASSPVSDLQYNDDTAGRVAGPSSGLLTSGLVTGYQLGRRSGATADYSGEIAEIIAVASPVGTTISESERSALVTYLDSKWGFLPPTGSLTIAVVGPNGPLTGNAQDANGTTAADQLSVVAVVGGVTYAATPASTGSWSMPVGPLATGSYPVTGTVIDGSGSRGTFSGTIQVDATAPTVTAAVGSVSSASPVLRGTLADAGGAGFGQLSIEVDGITYTWTNGGAVSPGLTVDTGTGTWSLDLAVAAQVLPAGYPTVTATATDAVGNSTTASASLLVDLAAPTASTSPLTTGDASPTISGLAVDPAPGSGVTAISVLLTGPGGVTVGPFTLADGQLGYTAPPGTWTLDLGALGIDLASGIYDVTVTATDATGQSTTVTSTGAVEIDTQAPTATIDDAPIFTNDTTPTITGLVTDPNGVTAIVVAVGGVTYSSADVGSGLVLNGDGTWSLTIAPPLADGVYPITVLATDGLGNTSTVSSDGTSAELTVDTVAPVVTAASTTTAALQPVLSGTVATPDQLETFRIVLTGPGGTVTIAAPAPGLTINGDGTWSLDCQAAGVLLGEGTTSIAVTAIDRSGNSGSAAASVVVDRTAPTATAATTTTLQYLPTISGTATDAGTSVSALTVVVRRSDGAPVVTVQWNATSPDAGIRLTAGTWTLDLAAAGVSPLANGLYDVEVTATDAVGNAGTDTTQAELRVHAVTPAVTIEGVITSDTTPLIGGQVTNPGAGVTQLSVAIVGPSPATTIRTVVIVPGSLTYASYSAYPGGVWTLDLQGAGITLGAGAYEIIATVTDAAGNAASDTTGDELVIDTTAPAIQLTGVPILTNDATPTLGGTATDPNGLAAISIELIGPAGSLSYSSDDPGSPITLGPGSAWSITLPESLADATYQVRVIGRDNLGNVTNGPNEGTAGELTVDTVAPVLSVGSLTTPLTSPLLTGRVDTPEQLASLAITLTPPTGPAVTITRASSALVITADGDWTLNLATAGVVLPDGATTVAVDATDRAGNVATTVSGTVVVDTLAPTATVTPASVAVLSGSTISGTVSDSGSGLAEVTVTVNGITSTWTPTGSTAGLTVDPLAGTWSLDLGVVLPSTIADGTYGVAVVATDAVGRTSIDGTADELLIDRTAPTVGLPDLASASDSGDSTSDNRTTDTTPTLTVSVSDALSGVGAVTLVFTPVGGGAAIEIAATDLGGGSWGATPTLAEGAHTVVATARDGLGNVRTSAALSLTIDTTVPTSAVTAVSDDTGRSATDGITSDATPTASGTAEADSLVSVFVDGLLVGSVTASGGTWSLALGVLSEGSHSVTTAAVDVAGNAGTPSAPVTVVVDTAIAAPVISALFDDTATDVAGGSTTDATLTATGTAEADALVTVYVDGLAVGSATASVTGAWLLDLPALTIAGHSLTAAAVDVAGNASAPSTTITVTIDPAALSLGAIDLVAGSDSGISASDDLTSDTTPTITVALVDPGAGSVSISVVWTPIGGGSSITVAASDAGGGIWSATPGSVLAPGSYSVWAVAVDGNGTTAQTSVLVVTIDTTAPIVATPDLVTASDSGSSTIDDLTNDLTPTVAVTVSDPGTGIGAVTLVFTPVGGGASITVAATAVGGGVY